ncbi:MAG TPA: glutaredoxin family protein [Stenomitos sp.]
MKTLILYSKPGCHLCEGLQEKLEQIQALRFDLEIRDITTQSDWFTAYQYEIPVLFCRTNDNPTTEQPIPRPSPRLSVVQLQQFLQPYIGGE